MRNAIAPVASHHMMFTPEKPRFKSAHAQNPSIEDVTKFLNSQGEDAHIVEGFYGEPERSILVENPKNTKGIMQMAKDFGQESVLHSNEGKHQLHYVNGPDVGKIVSGEGTNWTKSKPTDNYTIIHTVDGPLYMQHNLNFENQTKKSEDLQKAPLRFESYSPEGKDKAFPDLANSEAHVQVKKVALPNGLEYRQYRRKPSRDFPQFPNSRIIHALYDPKDNLEPLAYMETEHEEDPMAEGGRHPNVVMWSEVHPSVRGKGLGRQLYMASLVHGVGQITSGANVSPEAHKAWKSFRSVPGIGGRIAKYPKADADTFMSPGESAAYEADRHHIFVRDKSKLDMNKMFPPVQLGDEKKLASSEHMKKSISSLDDIRAQLETPMKEVKIDIPDHTVMEWSVPIHRWK